MIKIKNKVASNAAWIIACRIARMIVGLVVSMLTARFLGPTSYGIINYAMSISAFCLPLAQLGLDGILVKAILDEPQKEGEVLGTALISGILSSLLCIAGSAIFVSVANAGESCTIAVCILYNIILIFQVLELIQYWFQAKYLSKYTSIISFSAYFIVSMYKIFLLITKKSIYWFALSNAFDFMLISLALIVIYRKLGGQRLIFSKSRLIKLLSSSKYYILSNLMVVIFGNTDIIMIKFLINDAETGYYSAAVRCAGLAAFVFAAIIDSFRPYVLEGKKTSDIEFEKRIVKLYSIVIYLAVAVSIGFTLLSSVIVSLLYGSEYTPAVSALRIVVWYTTFSYFGGAKDVWILAEKKQKYLLWLNLSGALANIFLNAILIPLLGIDGAAIASLVTQAFANIVMLAIIKPLRQNFWLCVKALNPKITIKTVERLLTKKEK